MKNLEQLYNLMRPEPAAHATGVRLLLLTVYINTSKSA